MVTESEIQKAICKMLAKSPDCAYYTVNTTGLFSKRGYKYTIGKWFRVNKKDEVHDGMADITGMMVGGVHFAIETKKPGKEPTPDQWEYLNYVKDNGGLSGYATNILEAEKILRGYEIKL